LVSAPFFCATKMVQLKAGNGSNQAKFNQCYRRSRVNPPTDENRTHLTVVESNKPPVFEPTLGE